jgi:hypothetical protein
MKVVAVVSMVVSVEDSEAELYTVSVTDVSIVLSVEI